MSAVENFIEMRSAQSSFPSSQLSTVFEDRIVYASLVIAPLSILLLSTLLFRFISR